MKIGEWIDTPRFCKVKIDAIYENREQAYNDGFNEPTHYNSSWYDIYGKNTSINHMIFAAIKK